jgi:hypothetical protein
MTTVPDSSCILVPTIIPANPPVLQDRVLHVPFWSRLDNRFGL